MLRTVALATVLVLGSGCGGGSSGRDAAPATTSTTATTLPTTSTTFAASASDARLARRATLTVADLGARWEQYKPAQGALSPTGGCGWTPTGPLSKVGFGAFYVGVQAKFKGNSTYAYSSTLVFPSESTAKAWIAIRASKAYISCRVGQADAGERGVHPKNRVVASTAKDPNVGRNEYEGFVRFEGQSPDANGAYVTQATYDFLLYRHGRVVVNVELDRGSVAPGDPNVRVVQDTLGAALAKTLARAEPTA